MEKTIIIVAGGQGMRFNSDKPKQFLYIKDRPIAMHTIDLFHYYDRDMQIILGVAEKFFSYWDSICDQFHFDVPVTLSPGGETRYHTVKNALPRVAEGNLVGIHDAVRPLVYKHTIDHCYEEAGRSGAAIPCVPVHNTIREVTVDGSRWVDRDKLRAVQTPQVFQYEILMRAYEQEYSTSFTDDASVVESAGFPVILVEGNPENIKITTPEDLVFAESVFEYYKKKSGFF
jgi:2-C-methyl-D-erythritol 4-phosphate cytidylyltransferase